MFVQVKVQVKVKFTLEQATKAQRRRRGVKKPHSLKVVFKGTPEWTTSDKMGIPKASVIQRRYVTVV
jgi:hypothetical protein